ncbi:MAG: DsbA family protein [Parcubacteria group bacterium]|nr:DsbA family protein [Parcubacteria group bacterium]
MEEETSSASGGRQNNNLGNGAFVIASSILAVGVIFSGVYYATNNPGVASRGGNNNLAAIGAQNTQTAPIDVVKLPDDDPILGDANAPVTIVEFSDFQCPFCGKFFNETFPQIKSGYIDTGKVKLVYRDFPLAIHEMAQTYAEAGECAHEQGKFWEMHDKIFGEQKNGVATVADLKKWGKELGMREIQFNACLDTHKYADEVAKDVKDGLDAGVQGTPSFFINGKLVVGAVPFSVLQKEIETALKK